MCQPVLGSPACTTWVCLRGAGFLPLHPAQALPEPQPSLPGSLHLRQHLPASLPALCNTNVHVDYSPPPETQAGHSAPPGCLHQAGGSGTTTPHSARCPSPQRLWHCCHPSGCAAPSLQAGTALGARCLPRGSNSNSWKASSLSRADLSAGVTLGHLAQWVHGWRPPMPGTWQQRRLTLLLRTIPTCYTPAAAQACQTDCFQHKDTSGNTIISSLKPGRNNSHPTAAGNGSCTGLVQHCCLEHHTALDDTNTAIPSSKSKDVVTQPRGGQLALNSRACAHGQ